MDSLFKFDDEFFSSEMLLEEFDPNNHSPKIIDLPENSNPKSISKKLNYTSLKAQIAQKYNNNNKGEILEDPNSGHSNLSKSNSRKKSFSELMKSKAISILNKKIAKYQNKLKKMNQFVDKYLNRLPSKFEKKYKKIRKEFYSYIKLTAGKPNVSNNDRQLDQIQTKLDVLLKSRNNSDVVINNEEQKHKFRDIHKNFNYCLIKSSQQMDVVSIHEDSQLKSTHKFSDSVEQFDQSSQNSIPFIQENSFSDQKLSNFSNFQKNILQNEQTVNFCDFSNKNHKIVDIIKKIDDKIDQKEFDFGLVINLLQQITIDNKNQKEEMPFQPINNSQNMTLFKIIDSFVQITKNVKSQPLNLDLLLFESQFENQLQYYNLQNMLKIKTLPLNFEYSRLVIKYLLFILLFQFSKKDLISNETSFDLIHVPFESHFIKEIDFKFKKIIFGSISPSKDKINEILNKSENHFNILHNLFNSILFSFERILVYRDNSDLFERRELAKKTQTSAFKGGCGYVILMKKLEEMKVQFYSDPTDVILACFILFQTPQIGPLNHQFAKTLRNFFVNKKFQNTVQEIIVLFISRQLMA